MTKSNLSYVSLRELSSRHGWSELSVLEAIVNSGDIDVYIHVHNQYGDWIDQGHLVSVGLAEGYFLVPKKSIVDAFHNLKSGRELPTIGRLIFDPNSIVGFNYGEFRLINQTTEEESVSFSLGISHIDVEDLSCVEPTSPVRKHIRCFYRMPYFKDSSEPINKRFESVEFDFELSELLQAQGDWEDYYIPCEGDPEDEINDKKIEKDHRKYRENTAEKKAALKEAINLCFTDFHPSSSQGVPFNMDSMFFSNVDFEKLASNKKENSKDDSKLELLVCDLVMVLLAISKADIKDNNLVINKKTYSFARFKSLLKKEKLISVNALETIIRELKEQSLLSVANKPEDVEMPNRWAYKIDSILSKALENNPKQIEPFNLYKEGNKKS